MAGHCLVNLGEPDQSLPFEYPPDHVTIPKITAPRRHAQHVQLTGYMPIAVASLIQLCNQLAYLVFVFIHYTLLRVTVPVKAIGHALRSDANVLRSVCLLHSTRYLMRARL